MIRYLRHTEIDKALWDKTIAESANGLVYACSWYLDVLCPAQWDAIVEDDYKSVFPLPRRKKAGISYIYTPFFVQQLGAFSGIVPGGEKINLFLNAIPEEFRLVELNLNTCNHATCAGFHFVENQNFELSLAQPYEQLQRNYSENLIRNLRKTVGHSLLMNRDEQTGSIIDLFRSEKGMEIKHWGEKEYGVFKGLLSECSERGLLKVWGAYIENKLCAGIIFLVSPGRVIFLFSATNEIARASGAMARLIDRFINENAGRNLILDFEGSNEEGLARFYRSFGAQKTVYQRAVRNSLPGWINFLRKLRG